MSNVDKSPKSELGEIDPKEPRPLGVLLVCVLFVLFSIASILIAYIEKDGQWEIVLGCSLFLIFLLRGVFLGQEKGRKIGVFLGFFIAVLNFLELYEVSEAFADLQRTLFIAEGLFGALAAIYLIKLKDSSFFNE